MGSGMSKPTDNFPRLAGFSGTIVSSPSGSTAAGRFFLGLGGCYEGDSSALMVQQLTDNEDTNFRS